LLEHDKAISINRAVTKNDYLCDNTLTGIRVVNELTRF
jgi:hypothetical protein